MHTRQNVAYYRDLAEEMKRDNRRLRVEMSEKVETVHKKFHSGRKNSC